MLDALPVSFLFRMEAAVSSPTRIDPGPQGSRLILAATGGTFEGPELKGTIVAGPGSEWATLRPDGSLKVDVRLVLETDDGVPILMTYNGVGVFREGGLLVRTAPMFECADPRYAWLNHVQAVGLGEPIPTGIAYDVYRVS